MNGVVRMEPMSDTVSASRSSYDAIWKLVILPVIDSYRERYAGITVIPDAQEVIWERYLHFNRYCKTTYMLNPAGKLDRHKVCACYMYAIVSANVLGCTLAEKDTVAKYLTINEHLAITTGMSLLRAFTLSSIHCANTMSEEQKKTLTQRIDNGIRFPRCNHGNYRSNFASELHYTREENTYNILSLSNTLFLLEKYTLDVEVKP